MSSSPSWVSKFVLLIDIIVDVLQLRRSLPRLSAQIFPPQPLVYGEDKNIVLLSHILYTHPVLHVFYCVNPPLFLLLLVKPYSMHAGFRNNKLVLLIKHKFCSLRSKYNRDVFKYQKYNFKRENLNFTTNEIWEKISRWNEENS